MSFRFSKNSAANLATCESRLQVIARTALLKVDFAVIEGHREKDRQNQLFTEGKSHVEWPNSKHNSEPSEAFDLLPAPYQWDDREAFIRFAAFILGIGLGMGVNLRWGGDWNRNWDLEDNRFNDWPHFELTD